MLTVNEVDNAGSGGGGGGGGNCLSRRRARSKQVEGKVEASEEFEVVAKFL
jgi:hypothetical protein